jgi:outer membrane protein OmpA-like peptidoglycan-associated protein
VALTAPGGPIALVNTNVPAATLTSTWSAPKNGAEPVVATRQTADVSVKVDAKSMQGFQNIQFKLDSAQLVGAITFKQLGEIAKAMNQAGTEKFLIEGHTCDLGGDAHNKDLSQRRAESVVAYLIKLHVDPSRLQPLGFGAEQPLVANTSEKQRSKNRRVQIYRKL